MANQKRKHSSKNYKIRRRSKRPRQHGAGIFDLRKNIKTRMSNRIRTNALKPKNPNGKQGFDLHGKTLGAVKKVFGKRGMVPPPYFYLGPGNPLDEQLIHKNGRIIKYKVKPYNKLDQIASKHDVCYAANKKTKNRCDYEMLQDMKTNNVKIPRGMGTLVKGIIGAKAFAGI